MNVKSGKEKKKKKKNPGKETLTVEFITKFEINVNRGKKKKKKKKKPCSSKEPHSIFWLHYIVAEHASALPIYIMLLAVLIMLYSSMQSSLCKL